jgi:hypothetical protein
VENRDAVIFAWDLQVLTSQILSCSRTKQTIMGWSEHYQLYNYKHFEERCAHQYHTSSRAEPGALVNRRAPCCFATKCVFGNSSFTFIHISDRNTGAIANQNLRLPRSAFLSSPLRDKQRLMVTSSPTWANRLFPQFSSSASGAVPPNEVLWSGLETAIKDRLIIRRAGMIMRITEFIGNRYSTMIG